MQQPNKLPVHFKEITAKYDYSVPDKPRLFFDCKFTPVSCKDEISFWDTYDPENPEAFVYAFSRRGIYVENKLKAILALKRTFADLSLQGNLATLCTSNQSGWICHQSRWIFLTSNCGISSTNATKDSSNCEISSDNITDDFCTTKNAFLVWDHTLSPQKACSEVLTLLDMDFASAAPIFSAAILSLLSPLRNKHHLYHAPGLLISGPTGSGKTELACHLANFLTPTNGNLEQVFILQEGRRTLQKYTSGRSDCTVIFDDARRAGTQALKQNIVGILEMVVRSNFLSNEKSQLPVITGESGSLDSLLPSWRNRLLEVPLTDDNMAMRRMLIARLHQNPLVIRTCIRFFIGFLAHAFENSSLDGITNNIEMIFDELLPRNAHDGRIYDNVLLSFWAFKIFLKFCEESGVESSITTNYLKKYSLILKELKTFAELSSGSKKTETLLNALIAKLNLHVAVHGNYLYKAKPHQDWYLPQRVSEEYGHEVIIDHAHGYSGVWISDSSRITGWPYPIPKKTLLLIISDDLEKSFWNYAEFSKSIRQPLPFPTFSKFLKALRSENLLLGEPRYDENDAVNYRIPACVWTEEGFKIFKLLVFTVHPDQKYTEPKAAETIYGKKSFDAIDYETLTNYGKTLAKLI